MTDREALALERGYPSSILSQLLAFERGVRDSALTGAVLKSLYERGALIFSVGFQLPDSLRFVDFLTCRCAEDLAVSCELWDATLPSGGATERTIHGRSTEVWHRQADGAWKMTYDHASIAVNPELALRATADVQGLGTS